MLAELVRTRHGYAEETKVFNALDVEALKSRFAAATPFRYVKIDDFLLAAKAKEIANSYPPFESAVSQGRSFATLNEKKKVQVTNSSLFPAPVADLNNFLASTNFLNDLSYITGIPRLLADNELIGGGIHITGPGGRLDVHVDFNYIEERKLHRRLNLLLYLNSEWQDHWGGQFQLWDKEVKNCEATFAPVFNRCVIFETSNISYHGVIPVSPDAGAPRKSFAAYYYTLEAPAKWTGTAHSTIFKARPEERYKKFFAMPAAKIQNRLKAGSRMAKAAIKALIEPK